MLRNDAVRLCLENNFNTGFFEGSDNNCVIDAYELKVILHLILFLFRNKTIYAVFYFFIFVKEGGGGVWGGMHFYKENNVLFFLKFELSGQTGAHS